MNQKRLIILEDSSLRSYGGGQKISLHLIRVYLRKKFNVKVYDFCNDSEFCRKLPTKVVLNSYLDKFNNIEKFTFLKNKFNSLYLFLSLFKFLISYKNLENSYIISCTKKTYLLLIILKIIYGIKSNNTKFIIYYHMSNQYGFFEQIYYYTISILDMISNLIYSKKNRVLHLFVSKFARDSFTRFDLFTDRNNKIIYNPSLEEKRLRELRDYYHLVLESNPKKIVIISSLNKSKGVFNFAKIFKSFSGKTFSNFELHIYGYGEEEDQIKNISKICSNIYFHGKTNSPYIALKEAYCVIIPSIISEACPLVAIESMCAGRPCFSRNFGGQNELLRESNNYINNSNPYQIIRSIVNLDKKYLFKISNVIRNNYEKKYSLKNYFSEIYNFIN